MARLFSRHPTLQESNNTNISQEHTKFIFHTPLTHPAGYLVWVRLYSRHLDPFRNQCLGYETMNKLSRFEYILGYATYLEDEHPNFL